MAFLSYITFVSVLQLNALAVLGIRISQESKSTIYWNSDIRDYFSKKSFIDSHVLACNDHLKMFPPSSAEAFNDNDEHAAPKEFPFMVKVHIEATT